MGYDLKRFSGDVDEELICCICREVLRDPVQAGECEHAFCIECIQGWLNQHQSCPVDRTSLTQTDLRPPSRILRNIHKKLNINCDNVNYGCQHTCKLELLPHHLTDCPYNPKRPVQCSHGCGVEIPLDEMADHNCIQHLRMSLTGQIHAMETKLISCQMEIERIREHRNQTPINNQTSMMLSEASSSRESSGGNNSNSPYNLQILNNKPHNLSDEEIRWCQSLDEARVRRWGGMISTPDNTLQSMIRRSLQDSGCPQRLLNELMNCAHERKWPDGLNSLEMRQVNRVCYEQYVTRRIPSRQAVVVLFFENQHMEASFVRSPGMVLIFAHGID